MRFTRTTVGAVAIAGGLFLTAIGQTTGEPSLKTSAASSTSPALQTRLHSGELDQAQWVLHTLDFDRQRGQSSPTGSCDVGVPQSCEAQIGITGNFIQECGDQSQDQGWKGLAFPVITGGGLVDTLLFTVNNSFAGGDVFITTNTTDDEGTCQPDVLGAGACPWDLAGDGTVNAADLGILLGAWGPNPGNPADFNGDGMVNAADLAELLGAWGPCPEGGEGILAVLCCAVSGVPAMQQVELHFDPVMTSFIDPTWVVFVQRTGLAGIDSNGHFDGSSFPAHSVARDLSPSAPNQAFFNISSGGSGQPGSWTDLHFGNPDDPGTHYCIDLSFTAQDPEVYDCIANPEPTGACCFLGEVTCEIMRGFECGIAGQGNVLVVYAGDGSDCSQCPSIPEVCNPGSGLCTDPAGNGSAGCSDEECCFAVCSSPGFEFCCEIEWLPECSEQAEAICDIPASFPVTLANGPNPSASGYLNIRTSEYGAWTSDGFGGDGDDYKPVGHSLAEASFSSSFFMYMKDPEGAPCAPAIGNCKRELLSVIQAWLNVGFDDEDDTTLFKELVVSHEDPCPQGGECIPPSDTDGDGVNDTAMSAFRVVGGGTDLRFDLTQHIFTASALGPNPIGVLTQSYTVTNNGAEAVEFSLVRQMDYDLPWIGDFGSDMVGTTTNGQPSAAGLYVWQAEVGDPNTAVTVSSPQAISYYGAKNGIDPDGAEPGPAYGFGTDVQQWEAYGVPEGWANHIAGVGTNVDGESGAAPEGCNVPCDASIGLAFAVSLAASGQEGDSDIITITYTYGSAIPFVP